MIDCNKNFDNNFLKDHKVWQEKITGTTTFTKDHARRSYFIQIYNMQNYQKVRNGNIAYSKFGKIIPLLC